MIKVTTGSEKQQEVKPFPKLMIGRNDYDGVVVLFVTATCGTIIKGVGFSDGKEGMYKRDWSYGFFTDYNGPVTLQNV